MEAEEVEKGSHECASGKIFRDKPVGVCLSRVCTLKPFICPTETCECKRLHSGHEQISIDEYLVMLHSEPACDLASLEEVRTVKRIIACTF